MTTPVDARAFGALEAEVRHLREKLEEQGEKQDRQSEQIATILDILSQAKGGWKTMVAVGTAITALLAIAGAYASKILTFLGWR